jgi:hypothetical protein
MNNRNAMLREAKRLTLRTLPTDIPPTHRLRRSRRGGHKNVQDAFFA